MTVAQPFILGSFIAISLASKLNLCIQGGASYNCDGKLKDPNFGDISQEIYENVKLDCSEEYQSDLQDTVNERCKSWNKNDWVAVTYDNKWYPGVIIELC